MDCKNDIIIFNYSDAIFELDNKGVAISLIKLRENANILGIKNKVLVVPLDGTSTELFECKTNKYEI